LSGPRRGEPYGRRRIGTAAADHAKPNMAELVGAAGLEPVACLTMSSSLAPAFLASKRPANIAVDIGEPYGRNGGRQSMGMSRMIFITKLRVTTAQSRAKRQLICASVF
jgi:hypothetical protein